MKDVVKHYYAELKNQYATKIRQLVPQYDEMVRCIAELVQLYEPATVLDIGAGVGNLTQIILRVLPSARAVAIDTCEEMVSEARLLLQPAGDRVSVLQADILDYAPDRRFDVVLSNLALHNVPLDDKPRLLATIREWLNPAGAFIWGDLMRHADPRIQEHFVRQRTEFALAAGCPPDLVTANFEKEQTADYPLTVEQTLALAHAAGFSDPHIVWAHDTFAVFNLRTETRAPAR